MQSQGLRQVQKQTQNLVLAPQLRQSLKILQVPALELRSAILEELQTNPLLEEYGTNITYWRISFSENSRLPIAESSMSKIFLGTIFSNRLLRELQPKSCSISSISFSDGPICFL